MPGGSKQKPAETQHPWWLYTALLAGCGLRILYLAQLKATPLFSNLFSDSRLYADLADAILQGRADLRSVFMSPVYPILLAIVQAVTGDPLIWIRIIQITGGLLGIVLVYRLTEDTFGRTSAAWAAVLTAVYPPFIFFDNAVLIESTFTLLLVFHQYRLAASLRHPTTVSFVLAGLAMGGLVVYRGSSWLLFLTGAVYIWLTFNNDRRRARFTGVYSLSSLAIVAVFIVKASLAAGEFVPVTASGGLNFYAGNSAESDGTFSISEQFDTYADPSGATFAEKTTGKRLTPMEVSSFWLSRSLDWIASDPPAFLTLLGKKILLFFHPGEIEQTGGGTEFIRQEYGTILALPFPGFPIILALAFGGLAFARIKKHKGYGLHLAIAGASILSTVVFFTNGRLRTPVVILFAMFAGYAISEAVAGFTAKEWKRTLAVLTGATLVTVMIGFAQPAYTPRFDAEYNRLGDIAFQDKNYLQAEQYFSRAAAIRSSARVMTNLGNALAAQGKFAEAEHSYEQAIRADTEYAPAFYNKGNMAHQRGKPEVAYRYWLKTIELDPAFAAAYRNCGLLLYQIGKLEESRSMLTRYLEVETSEAAKNEIRRDLSTIEQMLRRNP